MACFCPTSATTISPPVNRGVKERAHSNTDNSEDTDLRRKKEEGMNDACRKLKFRGESSERWGTTSNNSLTSSANDSKELMASNMPWEFDMLESQVSVPPWDHDLLLLDINKSILESAVSRKLGKSYLQPWLGAPSRWPVTGKIFGNNRRMIISLCVSLSTPKAAEIDIIPVKITAHFLVDTGAPSTYLCEDAVVALSPTKKFYYDEYDCIPVVLQGFKHEVHLSPPTSHFRDVSLIGSDFLALIQGTLVADYGESKSFSITKGPGVYESGESDC